MARDSAQETDLNRAVLDDESVTTTSEDRSAETSRVSTSFVNEAGNDYVSEDVIEDIERGE